MFTKLFYRKSVKSLVGPKNILRKELKSYVTKIKLSAEGVTYLFTIKHKSYKRHFECGVISLIFFALCVSLIFVALCLL